MEALTLSAEEASNINLLRFIRACKYQAAIFALQLFLQQEITRDVSVSYEDICKFYVKKCSTINDFLTYRTLLFWSEDDERDGCEEDTPVTCPVAQEVFERIEEFMRARCRPDDLGIEGIGSLQSELLIQSKGFKNEVDNVSEKIHAAYGVAVRELMEQLFPDNDVSEFTIHSTKCILRASVLSTQPFFKRFSDCEIDSIDQFCLLLNEDCDVTEVRFESITIEQSDLEDIDKFADDMIVLKTHNDGRLKLFYDFALEYICTGYTLYKYNKPLTEGLENLRLLEP